MVTAPSPEPDIDWCHEAVQDVSRIFALTVDVLEEPMLSHICLGYLLCRVADTVEDAGHIPPETQVNLLPTFDSTLDPGSDWTMTEFRASVDNWLLASADCSTDWSVVVQSPTIQILVHRPTEFVQTTSFYWSE